MGSSNLDWRLSRISGAEIGNVYDLIEETGYEKGSLRYMKIVAEKFESARRRADLTFSHHLEVVKLPPEKQENLDLRYSTRNKLKSNNIK